MTTDYGEKERAFVDALKENTGRDLGEWLAAISAKDLPHRNDIIDWLRQQGFMFSKASWLERIHHNGGRLIYADAPKGAPASRRASKRRDAAASPSASAAATATGSAPIAPASAPPPAPSTPPVARDDLDALLAKAKAYRPLAQHLLAQIRTVRPAARFEAHDSYVAIADPAEFARIGIGPKELRLHLALGDAGFDEILKKGVPGGGLGKSEALSHMLVLEDARQIDRRLLELVARAAATVNG
jgi:hypothetical protein